MAAGSGIQIQYTTGPDATGVVSGMELAREMIADAYRLLAPYAGVCPTMVLTAGETADARKSRFDAHLEAQLSTVRALLAKQRRTHGSNQAGPCRQANVASGCRTMIDCLERDDSL